MKDNTSEKKIFVNSIIYTLSGLLMKCFSFFLLPLYTSYLSTHDYGITSISTSFVSTMSYVVSFSLFKSVTRFYVDFKDDSRKLKRFYGTVVSFIFISSSAWVVLFTVFRNTLSKYIFGNIDFYPVILITIITLVFDRGYSIYDTILKSQQKALKSSIITFCNFLCTVILNIVFVVPLKMGATGVVLSTLISDAIFTFIFLTDIISHNEIKFCIDRKLLIAALKYSIPIMPHNLSTQVAMLVSKVLIGNAGSMSSLGLYSIASQFGNIADTIQTYVNNAYGPWLFENLHSKEENYKKNIRNVSNMLASIIGVFIVGIGLFAQDYIIVFMAKSYSSSWTYIPLILLNFTIKIPYYFYVSILFYYKKASKYLFSATLSSSVLNVFLSFVLVPRYGAYGSICADIISMVLRVLIIYLISKKTENIGLYMKDFIINDFIIMAAISIGLIFSFIKFNITFNIINFAYKIVVFFIYCFYVLFRYRKLIKYTLKIFHK